MEVEGGGGYIVENSVKCTGKDDERKYIAIRAVTKRKQQQKQQIKKKG